MDSQLKIMNDNIKKLKEVIEKDFSNTKIMLDETKGMLNRSYGLNLIENLSRNIPYVNVYKLNQIMNGLTPILKKFQNNETSLSVEALFNKKQSMILRFLTSFHMLFGEIQILIEQNYQLQALGRLRLAFELLVIFKLSLENIDIFKDSLMFGNYHWKEYEDFFNPQETEETKSFSKYMEDKYSEKELKRPYFYIEKHIDRKFVMSKEFKNIFNADSILIHSWNMCHNFNHASAMVISLEDRPNLYDSMSKYAMSLIMFSIFKIMSIVFKEWEKVKDPSFSKILFDLKLKPLEEIMEIVERYVNDISKTEINFLRYIKNRK